MMEEVGHYLQLSAGELFYAVLLSLFIFLSLYLFYRLREANGKIKEIGFALDEANLDRASLMANSAFLAEDSANEMAAFNVERGMNNTLLQQELENYLLREQERAEEAAHNFVELSADFIDFLKVKSGKIQLKESSFVLNDMLDALAKSLRSQLSRTQTELIFDIDTKVPPRLIGDKKHIRLLLFNLLSNIIHHKTDSQVVLHARSVKEEKGLRLLFHVKGCGLGKGTDDPSRFFLPFTDDSSVDESMRIELYIARELARMMNGDITLNPDESNSNAFSIELFLAESNPDEKRYYHLPSRSMVGHHILIVASNKTLAKSINDMYEYFQNDVTILAPDELHSAPELTRKYHTIVIEKSALTLTLIEKLRAIKKQKKVNVVVLLSAKEKEDFYVPTGAVDQLLIKPVTIQSVFNTIVALDQREEDAAVSRVLQQNSDSQFNGDTNKKVFEDFQGRRILVIEGDQVNQKMLITLLGRSGINLSLAHNAQEGLWIIEKLSTLDFILLSCQVDVESRVRLSQKIRRISRYKGVPIILMGEKGTNADLFGIDETLERPVQAGALYRVMSHYLNKKDITSKERSETIPDIAFINTASLAARDGYEMASYDEALYLDILREFLELYGDSATKMNSVLVKDDLAALKQICLDVKGVAANIGAFKLSSITAQIHAAISKGKAKDLMALMQQYQPELERVKDEVKSYLKV